MAMLRVAASFWRLVIRYWRMGNLRAEGLAPGFLGVAFTSSVRGNALLISVENESMMIRLLFCGGKV